MYTKKKKKKGRWLTIQKIKLINWVDIAKISEIEKHIDEDKCFIDT